MNVSYYTSEFTSQVSEIPILSIPGTLWAYYLEYLWFYEPDSWVATIAYSCRVLAVLISLPVIILGLLVRFSSYWVQLGLKFFIIGHCIIWDSQDPWCR